MHKAIVMADCIYLLSIELSSKEFMMDNRPRFINNWSYLKPPQVIFALFDERSSAIASALSTIPRPDNSPSYFKAGKLDDVSLV